MAAITFFPPPHYLARRHSAPPRLVAGGGVAAHPSAHARRARPPIPPPCRLLPLLLLPPPPPPPAQPYGRRRLPGVVGWPPLATPSRRQPVPAGQPWGCVVDDAPPLPPSFLPSSTPFSPSHPSPLWSHCGMFRRGWPGDTSPAGMASPPPPLLARPAGYRYRAPVGAARVRRRGGRAGGGAAWPRHVGAASGGLRRCRPLSSPLS